MESLKKNNNVELDFERICILYNNAITGYFGIALGIVFLFCIIYTYSSPELATTWSLIVITAYLPRVTFSIQFARKLKKQEITPENIRPWENYMTFGSIVPYICFVSAIFLPYGENELVSVLFCALIFMFIATGGVLTITTSLGAIMLYINLAVLSIIIKCFMLDEKIFTFLGLLMFLALFLLLKLILRQHRTFVENIALKIENNKFSLTDPLTKLWNRRRLDLHVEKLIPTSQRSGEPFSIIMLDIDHFKQYNDTKGHGEGDELLKKVADILNDCSREQDLIVRYGGEEFIVLLPETRLRYAAFIAERILKNIKDKTDVTISAGLAEYDGRMDFDQLVNRADEALYAAKNNGRDQYVLAPMG